MTQFLVHDLNSNKDKTPVLRINFQQQYYAHYKPVSFCKRMDCKLHVDYVTNMVTVWNEKGQFKGVDF